MGVEKLNNAIREDWCRNRKRDIQHGGCQKGCTYISTSMQDSKGIPKANCMFSGSGNSVALSGRLYLEIGSQNFKMAAAKP
jgi:hypothetical protein